MTCLLAGHLHSEVGTLVPHRRDYKRNNIPAAEWVEGSPRRKGRGGVYGQLTGVLLGHSEEEHVIPSGMGAMPGF